MGHLRDFVVRFLLIYYMIIMHHPTGGVYVVIAELPEAIETKIGRRKAGYFKKGFYAYVGSALSGLEIRLSRHLGNRKKLHWHIDYLLEVATVREIILTKTNQKMECLLARTLCGNLDSISNFGCTDCNCPSHLFFCREHKKLNDTVLYSFNILNVNPSIITDLSEL